MKFILLAKMKKERCIHCNKKMEAWTLVCPHCGGVNGHNR